MATSKNGVMSRIERGYEKFTEIRKTIDKINKVYSKGCKEGFP